MVHSRSNTVALDEVFPSSGDRSRGHVAPRQGAPSRVSSKYQAAYQSAEMRRGILVNELEDAVAEMDSMMKKKQNLISGKISRLHSIRRSN